MKKIVLLILLSIFACSKKESFKYNLAAINTEEKLDSLLTVLAPQDSILKGYQQIFYTEGMHYNEIPIEEFRTYSKGDGYSFYTKKYVDKSDLLESIMNEEGEYTRIKDLYTSKEEDSLYHWNNKYREINVDFDEKGRGDVLCSFFKIYYSPIANVFEKVKKTKKQFLYTLIVRQKYSESTLFVNDINVTDEEGEYRRSVDLNPYILNNDDIKITFLVPKEAVDDDVELFLRKEVNYEREEESYMNKKIEDTDDPNLKKVVYLFKNEVPYSLKGWNEGQDLTKVENLGDKIHNLYKNLGEALKEKDEELINKMMYQYEVETHQFNYVQNHELSRRTWENWLEYMRETYKYTVSKNFDIQISPDNRLGFAFSKDLESMLITTGKEESEEFDYFFYLPKGSKELQIIR
ncbi:hypothetical protein [Tenacibaculum sp. M341]|uniref:hypothetical protein n=1 Tax=Tenacibaculum sp. M341 TaxID=2530339 RepID=UPI00104FE440|nr:hypothetical protein [Tenacibaculum sp. M341]TCI94804.1 hypothetical protein EYW44_00345 [Tenacibaculum sp. M341]